MSELLFMIFFVCVLHSSRSVVGRPILLIKSLTDNWSTTRLQFKHEWRVLSLPAALQRPRGRLDSAPKSGPSLPVPTLRRTERRARRSPSQTRCRCCSCRCTNRLPAIFSSVGSHLTNKFEPGYLQWRAESSTYLNEDGKGLNYKNGYVKTHCHVHPEMHESVML